MKTRIGFLRKAPNRDAATPILSEIFAILKRRNVEVAIIVPAEQLIDLPKIRVTCNLYVLRPGVELSLSLAGILNDRGATIVNSFSASSIVQDKCRVTAKLLACGIATPHTYVTGMPAKVLKADAFSRFVIKPHRGSAGEGVEFVLREDLPSNGPEPVFIQECLVSSYGEDLKVYVIGNEVFCLRRIFPARTLEEKLGHPASLTPQIRDLALSIGKIFGLEIYGIDIIETEQGPFVIDVNYFPSMVGVPEAAERIADYLYCKATSACCYIRADHDGQAP